MREYIRVLWKHALPNEPIEMHYEVLPDRSVPRMVEIFVGGRAEADTVAWHAARNPMSRGNSLVDGDMPTTDEIRATTEADSPGQFEVFVTPQSEFETVFQRAMPLIGAKEEIE
jgi:hypothetical protein